MRCGGCGGCCWGQRRGRWEYNFRRDYLLWRRRRKNEPSQRGRRRRWGADGSMQSHSWHRVCFVVRLRGCWDRNSFAYLWRLKRRLWWITNRHSRGCFGSANKIRRRWRRRRWWGYSRRGKGWRLGIRPERSNKPRGRGWRCKWRWRGGYRAKVWRRWRRLCIEWHGWCWWCWRCRGWWWWRRRLL